MTVNVVWTDLEDTYDSWKVAGKYKMGNNAIKLQYWDKDIEGSAEADGRDIGLEHNFSKRTQAHPGSIYT